MKEMESITKTFINSGIIGKIILAFVLIFLCLFAWNVFINNIVLKQLVEGNNNIEDMINKQTQIDVFRKCIKKSYDDAMVEYNENFIKILGETMKEYQVTFPQKLNLSIQTFRKKAELIKDCLIFPEDLE